MTVRARSVVTKGLGHSLSKLFKHERREQDVIKAPPAGHHCFFWFLQDHPALISADGHILMLCYPFYRLQIKKHHSLDTRFVASQKSPWAFCINMTVDRKTVRASWDMYSEGLCMCVLCVCSTPSETQTRDVPLIYTTPPHTPTEYLYSFLCYFYKINDSAPSDKLLWSFFIMSNFSEKKCTFYLTHSLEQSHSPFARTLNGAWSTDWLCEWFFLRVNKHQIGLDDRETGSPDRHRTSELNVAGLMTSKVDRTRHPFAFRCVMNVVGSIPIPLLVPRRDITSQRDITAWQQY